MRKDIPFHCQNWDKMDDETREAVYKMVELAYNHTDPPKPRNIMKTIIVAGITRTGLTATMHMLYKGGFPCMGTYPAFEDYNFNNIDFERNKGKAIKLVDTQRQFPPTGDYHVIMLKRDHTQQAKSIIRFLRACGQPVQNNQLVHFKKSLVPDYKAIEAWGKRQSGFMVVEFENLIKFPLVTALRIQEFIGEPLNTELMASAILKRSSDCSNTILETHFF